MLRVMFALALAAAVASGGGFPVVIEDFDDGTVELGSFPTEDVDPDSWALDSVNTYLGSPFALRLFGNTWKLESIAPVALDSADAWDVAAYIEEPGEIQAFGLVDSAHSLFYVFAGSQVPVSPSWVTVYEGAFAEDTWNVYRLPVADDWQARFGYVPTVVGVVYVNDRDGDPSAVSFFDHIVDVTGDLPVAPSVEVWYEVGGARENRDGSWSVTVRFHSRVTDPDSPWHSYAWQFGDDSTSADSAPVHVYTVTDDHEYTVLLAVEDSTGLVGRASCRVAVEPGPSSFPLRVNFTGDVMLARRYEAVIDTLGVENIFEPTRPWLGDAADLTIANLECPLCTVGTRHPTKDIVFRGRPANVAGLVHAGIDAVTLANNHVVDYGAEGMAATMALLDSVGIGRFGAGMDARAALEPVFRSRSGVSFGFVGLCNRTGRESNYQPFLDAGYEKPGFALLDSWNLAQGIAAARDHADIVVVGLHAGEEYAAEPADGDGDDGYSRFALVPSFADAELRHYAVEQGADLVVCHHPHVLQGFEVYRGVLIAHSLGNFAFDQEYPETYPSVILDAEVGPFGFRGFSLVPVYIDDYIPRRAEGELGAGILDYLARRSRELGTYVIVDRDSVAADIVLDTSALSRWTRPHDDELVLRADSGWWVSEPLRLARTGCLSGTRAAVPPRDWQFRLGREAVWFGNFEDEGASLWQVTQPDEFYDTLAHRGRRSLAQARPEGTNIIVTGLEERPPAAADTAPCTVYGRIRTENSRDAGVSVRYYTTRDAMSPVATHDLDTLVGGTTGWTGYWHDYDPPARGAFYDLRLQSYGPDSGEGRAWFDDVGIIEWSDWQALDSAVAVEVPNDWSRVQLRTTVETPSAALAWEEMVFEPPLAVTERPAPVAAAAGFAAGSNPSPAPVLHFTLSGSARVTLRVYNCLGQEVRTLVDGRASAGAHAVRWDGCDSRGRVVGAGAYFCRLEAGELRASLKVVIARPGR